MYRSLVLAFSLGLVVQSGLSQPVPLYDNAGIVTTPPTINALNFLNSGQFYATNGFMNTPYYTYNTLSYTNRGLMQASVGFQFETVPTDGLRRPALNFVNQNGGSINTGGNLEIAATNIVNRGTLSSGSLSKLTLKGQTVDLSQSVVSAGTFGSSGFLNSGVHTDYWGSGVVSVLSSGSYNDGIAPSASTPSHTVTNVVSSSYRTSNVSLSGQDPAMHQFVRETADLDTGRTSYVQVVYLVLPTEPDGTVSTRITNEVTFFKIDGTDLFESSFSPVGIDWFTTIRHPATGADVDVELSLYDDFALNPDIFFTLDFPISPTLPAPTYQPSNFDLLRFRRFFGWDVEVPAPLPASPLRVTHPVSYSALGVSLDANSIRFDTNVLDSVSVTNLPGRIEIVADDLNLNRTRLEAENFLSIKGTNHYRGSFRSTVISPFTDITLASTNELMTIEGLISDELPSLDGQIRAYSSFWKRNYTVDEEDYEDNFAVLVVDARTLRIAQPKIHGLALRAENLVLDDKLNVQQNLNLDCISLTISNAGHLNMIAEQIVWSDSLPRLTALTNYGAISAINTVKFMQGSHPNAPEGAPYEWFVNHGIIDVGGLTVSANNLIHSGEMRTSFGDADLRFGNAILTNGIISYVTTGGGVTVAGDNLFVSNTIVIADKKMTLSVGGTLDDGGVNGNNFWLTGNGFDLPVKPSVGDLLGTTIRSFANDFGEVEIRWAGEDRGVSNSGYENNAALGHLWLDGGFSSLYRFRAAGAQNALYVENFVLSEDIELEYFYSIEVDPNFTVYFRNLYVLVTDDEGATDLQPSSLDPSEFQSKTGGRIRWMGSPPRADVNLRDGKGNIIGTINVDTALRTSTSIDSDGDGVVNNDDAFPFDGPLLQTQITESGEVQLDWNAAANTTYTLWRTFNFTNWEQVTQITSGSTVGLLGVQIPALTNACTFKLSYSP